jgi:hypothetical protein
MRTSLSWLAMDDDDDDINMGGYDSAGKMFCCGNLQSGRVK